MQAVGVLVGLLAQDPHQALQSGELLVALVQELRGHDRPGGVLGEEVEHVDVLG
jgi:hypothetical protein